MSLLKSEINSSEVEEEITGLAEQRFGDSFREAFYEHGQWWVSVETCCGNTEAYSVVTCSHGSGFGHTDLDFEEV